MQTSREMKKEFLKRETRCKMQEREVLKKFRKKKVKNSNRIEEEEENAPSSKCQKSLKKKHFL